MPTMNSRMSGVSPAVADLGLGAGDRLVMQVKDETEEQRRQRIREFQERELMGGSGSLATFSLFGGSGAGAS